MKKSLTWNTKDGKRVEFVAEYTKVLEGKEIHEHHNVTVFVDGKELESTWIGFKILDTKNESIKKIDGLDKVKFTADRAVEIEKLFEEVKELGITKEAAEFEELMKAKKEEKEIKRLEKIIEAAEKQHTMMTRKEQKQWEKNYNRINNEGGEGYIPKSICVEDYEAAKAELAEIRRKAK